MTETEQRYHSNKQEFLALKWAVTEQFHEYLSPYGKNRNEFVVRTDNNPLTYIFFSANLDAAGQRWVAQLASYNFSLEYQKGKDNTVADFLSHLDDRLPAGGTGWLKRLGDSSLSSRVWVVAWWSLSGLS